jgi:oligopeptide transport system substrate-binding protein
VPPTTRAFHRLRFLLTLVLAVSITQPAVAADEGVDIEAGTVRLLIAAEPGTLNSLRATDGQASFLLRLLGEGLLHYDAAGKLQPAIALRWEMNGASARFWLRKDARWEDGTPITAADFVHAWREVLRPQTAAPYAPLLYPIRHAREIARGELPVERLAVTAAADDILDIEFAEPCAWFPALTAHMTLLPLPAHFHPAQDDRYAADAATLLSSGAYRLTQWVHGAQLVLERNPHYRDAAAVRIRRIELPYITSDTQSELNLFLDGRIALANVSGDSVNRVLPLRLQLRQFRTGSVEFLGFNFREGRVTRNAALRRALQAAIDPAIIVNRVVRLPAARATDSLFPSVLRGRAAPFVEEFPLAPPPRGVAVARAALQQAMREFGVKRIPPLYLLASDESTSQKTAEYLQSRLAETLGLDVRIDRQIFKQRLRKMDNGEYDMALANWSPDFDDPITFGDLFASWNPFNRGRYANADYDRWVRFAQTSTDQPARLAAMDRLQQLVLSDPPIIPLYENARIYLQHPRLHGVVRAPFGGDPDLRFAWLE